jgi:hypothetical protein
VVRRRYAAFDPVDILLDHDWIVLNTALYPQLESCIRPYSFSIPKALSFDNFCPQFPAVHRVGQRGNLQAGLVEPGCKFMLPANNVFEQTAIVAFLATVDS